MQNQASLLLRNDTILGVCEAIGQDFGFNPLYLRLGFIAPLFFQPMATFLAYLGLGAAVAASRLFAPDKSAVLIPQDATQPTDVEADKALAIAA